MGCNTSLLLVFLLISIRYSLTHEPDSDKVVWFETSSEYSFEIQLSTIIYQLETPCKLFQPGSIDLQSFLLCKQTYQGSILGKMKRLCKNLDSIHHIKDVKPLIPAQNPNDFDYFNNFLFVDYDSFKPFATSSNFSSVVMTRRLVPGIHIDQSDTVLKFDKNLVRNLMNKTYEEIVQFKFDLRKYVSLTLDNDMEKITLKMKEIGDKLNSSSTIGCIFPYFTTSRLPFCQNRYINMGEVFACEYAEEYDLSFLIIKLAKKTFPLKLYEAVPFSIVCNNDQLIQNQLCLCK